MLTHHAVPAANFVGMTPSDMLSGAAGMQVSAALHQSLQRATICSAEVYTAPSYAIMVPAQLVQAYNWSGNLD